MAASVRVGCVCTCTRSSNDSNTLRIHLNCVCCHNNNMNISLALFKLKLQHVYDVEGYLRTVLETAGMQSCNRKPPSLQNNKHIKIHFPKNTHTVICGVIGLIGCIPQGRIPLRPTHQGDNLSFQ